MTPYENAKEIASSYLESARTHNYQRAHEEWYVRTLVLAAIEAGATWREVGEALHVSPQAAWSKYRPNAPAKIQPWQK